MHSFEEVSKINSQEAVYCKQKSNTSRKTWARIFDIRMTTWTKTCISINTVWLFGSLRVLFSNIPNRHMASRYWRLHDCCLTVGTSRWWGTVTYSRNYFRQLLCPVFLPLHTSNCFRQLLCPVSLPLHTSNCFRQLLCPVFSSPQADLHEQAVDREDEQGVQPSPWLELPPQWHRGSHVHQVLQTDVPLRWQVRIRRLVGRNNWFRVDFHVYRLYSVNLVFEALFFFSFLNTVFIPYRIVNVFFSFICENF